MTAVVGDLEQDSLHIGDYVLLKDVFCNCYLTVEGILNEEICVVEGADNLLDALFCVHLQRQYSASRDLNAFLKQYDNDVKKIEDESAKKYLLALQKGRENEKKLNDTYMRKKYGQRVSFGDIIQLYHLKSRKYLTVTDNLAKDERENTLISLDVNGSAFSWIQITPRFKIDKEGDRVLNHAELYLKIAERSNEFLHTADRPPLSTAQLREVNCALETTSWRLNIFQSAVDTVEANVALLMGAQLVTLYDPETRSNLGLGEEELTNLDASTGTDFDINNHRDRVHTVEEAAEGEEGEEFEPRNFHPYGDLILGPVSTENFNSNYLWILETSKHTVGGPIAWKTDSIRLRHLNSGRYLSGYQRIDLESDLEIIMFVGDYCRAADLQDDTLFTVTELNSANKHLSNGRAVQLAHHGFYFERGDLLESVELTYPVKGTMEKASALSLIINRYEGDVNKRKPNTATSSTSSTTADSSTEVDKGVIEPLDVHSGLTIRRFLQKYCDMICIPRHESISTIWPSETRNDLEFFQFVADKAVYFSQGFAISTPHVQLGIDKGDNKVQRLRQGLLREQGTLEIALRMIHLLVPMTEKLESIKAKQAKRKSSRVSDEELASVHMAQTILSKCFMIVFYCIGDHEENQIYVADFMYVLLAHLNEQPLAGKCVTEMLSKNIELQETKIGTREIQIFVDKLRSSRMNAMYLQLLQACCSCEGNGVDGNQCKIANMLFSDTNDIIINLHADYVRSSQVSWSIPSLFMPPAPIAGSPLRGDNLVYKGIPQLSLAWTTNSIDFSPLGLFGKLSVNVEELFRRAETGESLHKTELKRAKGKKRTAIEQKVAVANYFVAEMFLSAEMCLDRNYVAMHKLDALFPYEVLVTMLKLNVTSNVKSAALRLLMCLHVDRDPQASSKIPCLTRTWTDIKRDVEPRLPYVEPARQYVFGLVQQIISEHVREMAGAHWDELSRHMLKMLKTLFGFNFYGTNERLLDVIVPLIAALDRRHVIGINDNHDNSLVVRSNKKGNEDKELDVPAQLAMTLKPRLQQSNNNEDNTFQGEEEFKQLLQDQAQPTNSSTSSVLKTIHNAIIRCNSWRCRGGTRVMALRGDGDETINADGEYIMPLRYSKAPIFELETMVEAVEILAFAQKVIEDRNLSLLLRHFFNWEAGTDKRAPADLFEQVIKDAKQLSLDCESFDDVMIDTLMFVHTPLVQSSLELLMAHHSTRRILLDNARNVQLLASHKRERQYKLVDQMLKQLEQNAETHELWGELANDLHHATNKQTKDIMRELADMCRVKRFLFEFDEDYTADGEIQDLLRNLGCFEICLKVTGLLESVESSSDDDNSNDEKKDKEVEELSEVSKNTKELCRLCNELLYWFMLRNPRNQELGFDELEWFLSTLDDDINSHKVIKAIFSMNEALMRQVPHTLLSDLVDRMLRDGRSAHYLALFSAIPNVGFKNIKENQMEIVKVLTSPGVITRLNVFLVPIKHVDYEEKRALMAPFLSNNSGKDVPIDELPQLLAFHLEFLNVLSGCTVGQKNVASVEAKVQSIFNYSDLIDSILDPGTILVAKVILTRFLFNAVFDVELKVPNMDTSPAVWRLFDHFTELLTTGKEELKLAANYGWGSPEVSRQKIELIVLIIMIIRNFFSSTFDLANFRSRSSSGTSSEHVKKNEKGCNSTGTKISSGYVNKLIVNMFHRIREIYDLDSPRLGSDIKLIMYEALLALKDQAEKYIQVGVVNHNANNQSMASIPSAASIAAGTGVASIAGVHIQDLSTSIHHQGESTDTINTAEDRKRDPAEAKLITKYEEFLNILHHNDKIQYAADNENIGFINILENLPYIADFTNSDVRYESLIRKLVFHIRENIKMVNNQKRMDNRVAATSCWIIKAFRTMIENKMKMSIYERDEHGGEVQDLVAAPVVNALNSCGATALCLDLIAVGIDNKLQLEAIKLGVGLLFKEGGALEVQGLMNEHLRSSESDLFFKQVRMTLQKLQEWHEWNEIAKAESPSSFLSDDNSNPEPPKEILIIRFLQLMCEGHYLPNQELLREQSNNHTSCNILDDLVNYLNYLSRIPCQTSTGAAVRVSATILEVIQGPCERNQLHFALNTELVETLNRLNRARLGEDLELEIQLKRTSIDILQALLEAQGDDSIVYSRVLSVVHLDIINIMSKKPLTVTASNATGANSKNISATRHHDRSDKTQDKSFLISHHIDLTTSNKAPELSIEEQELQTECVVLLQMFCTFRPSLYEELGISRKLEDIVGSGTAMIEIVWRNEVHRRFFHVPSVCEYLAKSSKDNLVENVNRASPEDKLIDFLARAHDLYREVKHQKFLTKMNLSRVFNRVNQNHATWITFLLAILNNVLFITQYELNNGTRQPQISPFYNTFTNGVNATQSALAGFTLLLWLVVSSPVVYQGHLARNVPRWTALFYTAIEPFTLYYTYNLILCFMGLFVQNYFVALQLLDIIVKNSTTRAVLMAIVTPAKQLVMAMILEFFVIYIFAFFLFYYFIEDVGGDDGTGLLCDSLWNCVKFSVSYGFQEGGGVADTFAHTRGIRLLLDLAFFVIVLIILLNVFLGMIIDTFGSLRAQKNERERDTTEVCFVCGISKQVFDRASDEPDGGFKTHVKIDHNMWNYLFFVFLLWEQDKDDDDGLEQYVRKAIDRDEISWFPINKAFRLDRVATKSEVLRKDLSDAVSETAVNVANRLDDFQHDVGGMLEQLMATLRQDPVNDGNANNNGRGGQGGDDDRDDGDMNDDMTYATESSYMIELMQGKQLSIACDRINGLALPCEELLEISLRILSDNGGVIVIPNFGVEEETGSVFFDSSVFTPLLDNVQTSSNKTDKRGFQIQVLQGDVRVMHSIAVLDYKAVDLLSVEDPFVATRKFATPAQASVCNLTIMAKSVSATRNYTPAGSAVSKVPSFTSGHGVSPLGGMKGTSRGVSAHHQHGHQQQHGQQVRSRSGSFTHQQNGGQGRSRSGSFTNQRESSTSLSRERTTSNGGEGRSRTGSFSSEINNRSPIPLSHGK